MVVDVKKSIAVFAVVIAALVVSGCVSEPPAEPVIVLDATPEPVVIIDEAAPLVKMEVVGASDMDIETEHMYRTHGRYLNEPYRFKRDNASGTKDLEVEITVWGYRLLRSYQESAAEDYGTFRWWLHKAPQGQQYLFAFIRMEMVGESRDKDPRMWGFDASHFAAQVYDSMAPLDWTHTPCIAIKELMHTGTRNDDSLISDYGKTRLVSIGNGASFCEDNGWLRMGKSNAWDGYIIWVVPDVVTASDIKIHGAFAGFGNAWWKLTERPGAS